MSKKNTKMPDFWVTHNKNRDGHRTEVARLELNLNVNEEKDGGGLSLAFLVSLATDAIIDCALIKYPHLITEDPMDFYQTKVTNDSIAELAESAEWRQKASKELLALAEVWIMGNTRA